MNGGGVTEFPDNMRTKLIFIDFNITDKDSIKDV